MPSLKVILLGPPGAGKGTQAARVSDKLGVTRVSSGDLFREQQQKDTELGRLARSYMERGALVPDEVTIKMVMEWVKDPQQAQGFVIDGFPRTLAQAEALDTELADSDGIDKVLHIYVSDEELIQRLSGRLICRQCQTPHHTRFSPPAEPGKCDNCGGELYQRADDMPEAVLKRIEVYANETKPLVQYYKEKGKLVEINGEGSIEEVGQALIEAIS
jgi:adenylate kinase